MSIRFGPAGLGSVKDAINRLQYYNKLNLKACEIAFTYGVYIKNKEDARKIGDEAKKQNIKLSIHAPYWINLNSAEKKKIEESKKRILDCCRIGNFLQAYCVVFHPGFYGKMQKDETYGNIKKAILEIQKEIRKNKWNIKLAPETTGKINVFGSVDEILKLTKETKCFFCIDFAHILAREKSINYKEILNKVKKFKNLHIHFSGIVYGEKGEKSHKLTDEKQAKELLMNLKNMPKNKEIVIINESPLPVQDAVKMLRLSK